MELDQFLPKKKKKKREKKKRKIQSILSQIKSKSEIFQSWARPPPPIEF